MLERIKEGFKESCRWGGDFYWVCVGYGLITIGVIAGIFVLIVLITT